MAYCLRCGEHTAWWMFWKWFRKHSCRTYQEVSRRTGRHLKVSELRQIDTPSREDLILISDVSDNESKKMTLAQFKAFIRS